MDKDLDQLSEGLRRPSSQFTSARLPRTGRVALANTSEGPMTAAMDRPTVVAAMPTPFDDDEELDLPGRHNLARQLVGAGCDALFVGGTTGEYPALTNGERLSLVEASAQAVGAERIMAHVGSACEEIANGWLSGLQLWASVNCSGKPYFLPADTDCQFDYFQRISEATGDGHLWLYIYPKRTGNQMSTDLLERLLDLLMPWRQGEQPGYCSD